jgi:hypothetical protein
MRNTVGNALLYDKYANGLRTQILSNYKPLTSRLFDFDRNYGRLFQRLEKGFSISSERSEAGFFYEDNHVVLFPDGLDLILENILNRRDLPAVEGMREEILRHGIEMYVLHEVRHITQGIPDFSTVQMMKQVSGPDTVGKFDLIADVDAAKVQAAIITLRDGDWDEAIYFTNLRNSIFLCGEIGLDVFKAPLSRPHKVRRIVGLAITALRIETALPMLRFTSSHRLDVPLDSAIWPEFGDNGDAQFFQLVPSLCLLKTSVPVCSEDLQAVVARFGESSFAEIYADLRRVYRRSAEFDQL